VALKAVQTSDEAMGLMDGGWVLAAASFDSQSQRWRFLMGRPDVGLEYDDESDAYA